MAIKSLIINPGSTSTKLGIFEDETLIMDETLRHSTEEIAQYATIIDQKDFRKNIILAFLKEKNIDVNSFQVIVGRGGLLKPIPGGTYPVTEKLIADLKAGVQGEHVHIEEKVEREQVAKVTGTNKDDSAKKEPVRNETKKIRPNDPCPCGSGKKYKNCHVSEDQIFVGVGSDDVLSMAFLTFFNSTLPIIFPDITYSFYDVWADLYHIPYHRIPLDDNFAMIKEDYFCDNGGVIFPNPNAPTGLLEDITVVEEIIRKNPGVVVIVDEAYIDFGGKSALSLVDRYENLLVVQTFSKSRAMLRNNRQNIS